MLQISNLQFLFIRYLPHVYTLPVCYEIINYLLWWASCSKLNDIFPGLSISHNNKDALQSSPFHENLLYTKLHGITGISLPLRFLDCCGYTEMDQTGSLFYTRRNGAGVLEASLTPRHVSMLHRTSYVLFPSPTKSFQHFLVLHGYTGHGVWTVGKMCVSCNKQRE